MRKILATLALGLAVVTGALAQAWPSKPVTLLVPFPPGGSTDLIARTLGAKLQEKLGGTFLVDNKAGAGGTVGAAQAKRSAPDGYTIFVSSLGPFVIGPHLVKNPGYDPLKDFDYITVAVQAPNVLTVPANSPHKTFADLFKFIKANPDKMTFASAGNGTSDHLTAELFWQETGTKGVHVPVQGRRAGDAGPARRHGRCDVHEHQHRPAEHQGRQAARARDHEREALAAAARCPDDGRARHQGRDGLFVAGVRRAEGSAGRHQGQAARRAGRGPQRPRVKPKLLELGFEIVGNTPEQFTAFQASEFARWKKVIEVGKITG
jgi:tripartite-type tricarboxylate transporter receptor subunit TctC